MKSFKAIIIMIILLGLISCGPTATRQQRGTGYGVAGGAAIGAILGQAIGGNTEGTLIGAAAGALVGGLAGNQIARYMDRQEQDLRYALADQQAASVQREQDMLHATFQSDVFFDFDSSMIKPGGQRELSRVADVFNRYRKTMIVIEGHTDRTGPEYYNQTLSERRAEAVRNYLIQEGVIPERLRATGFGESQPISSDPSQNRRVEIYIAPIRQR